MCRSTDPSARRTPCIRTESPAGLFIRRAGAMDLPARISRLAASAVVGIAPAAQAQTADPVYAVTYLDVGTNSVVQGVDLIKKYRDQPPRAVESGVRRPAGGEPAKPLRDHGRLEGSGRLRRARQRRREIRVRRRAEADPKQSARPAHAANLRQRAVAVQPATGALYMVEHVDFLGGDPPSPNGRSRW